MPQRGMPREMGDAYNRRAQRMRTTGREFGVQCPVCAFSWATPFVHTREYTD